LRAGYLKKDLSYLDNIFRISKLNSFGISNNRVEYWQPKISENFLKKPVNTNQ
jgi:hypothetical protein